MEANCSRHPALQSTSEKAAVDSVTIHRPFPWGFSALTLKDSHLRTFSPEVQPLYKRGKTASLCIYLIVRRSPSICPSVHPSFHPPFFIHPLTHPPFFWPSIGPSVHNHCPFSHCSLLPSLRHDPLIQAPILPEIQPFIQEVLTAPHHVSGTVLGAGTWARAKYIKFLT